MRVFLVEDSPLFRERLAEYLQDTGSIEIVGWADREQAAVEALRHCAWDVLIVDLQLKQGTGLGVLSSLSGVRRPPHSKTIVLTNHDFYLYRRKASEVGADLYLIKDRDFRQLARVLRELAKDLGTQPQSGRPEAPA